MHPTTHKVTALVAHADDVLVFQHPTTGIQFPAGTVEPGESALAAAVREAWEETGVRVDGGRVVGVQWGAETRRFVWFEAVERLELPEVCATDGHRFRPFWLPADEIDRVHPGQRHWWSFRRRAETWPPRFSRLETVIDADTAAGLPAAGSARAGRAARATDGSRGVEGGHPRGGALALRAMRDDAADYAAMGRWFSDDRVLEFYGGEGHRMDADGAREKYRSRVLGDEPVHPVLIEWQRAAIGYLQYYPVASWDDYALDRTAFDAMPWAVDLFIGEPALWGRGLGSSALSMLLRHLSEDLGVADVVIDPRTDNPRAIRAYEKCGFRAVGTLAAHEEHDGEWCDCLLMRWRSASVGGEA